MSSGAKTGWNYFKTAMLMAALTAVLVLLGGIIGGTTGLIVMVIIAVAFNFAMYWMSGPMALKMSRAVAVTPEQAPELHAMVDRLAARSAHGGGRRMSLVGVEVIDHHTRALASKCQGGGSAAPARRARKSSHCRGR